jgi:NTP pyrophosphatase (non-canonical NTP hydrolase)
MKNYADNVQDTFNRHSISYYTEPTFIPEKVFDFRLKLIQEEVQELVVAYNDKKSLVEITDALVDLVYVTIGLAIKMGLPFNAAWQVVHNTNLFKKIRGPVAKRGDNVEDLVRLDCYTDPKELIASLLEAPLLYKRQAVITGILYRADNRVTLQVENDYFGKFAVEVPNNEDTEMLTSAVFFRPAEYLDMLLEFSYDYISLEGKPVGAILVTFL